MIARARTVVVALLVAVVGLRFSASQPLSGPALRIAQDPGAAIRSATDGWTVAGTLGAASAQGIRELPLALFSWLGDAIGLSPSSVQTGWRILVLLLAVTGAVRLARRLLPAPEQSEREPWSPWVAALLFSAGLVLVSALVTSPLDGLAAATLPWIVTPLLTRAPGWGPAAASAAWLGLAGVGSPYWALAALGAGIAAAAPRSRREVVPALVWLMLAAVSCSWWIAALIWETRHAPDVSGLIGETTLRETMTEAVGRPDLPLVLLIGAALGPFVVAVSALALRLAGVDPVFVGGLLAAGVLALAVVWLGGWVPPVVAPAAGDPVAGIVGPVFGWFSLCGLVGWSPLVRHLAARLRALDVKALPSAGRDLTGPLALVLVSVVVALTAVAGVAATAAEPPATTDSLSRLRDEVEQWSREAPAGRVLVLPAGGSDSVALGTALGRRPWVGRDSLPTSGAAATIAIDDALTRLGRGDGAPGTLSALRRLGVTYVLVELGEPVPEDRANPTALVRAALTEQGAERTAVLRGSDRPAPGAAPEPLLDFGVRSITDQVEIWALPDPADGWVYQGQPIDVVGDAGSVSDLADAGVLGSSAIRLSAPAAGESVVLSDSPRRRDIDQRVPVDPYGPLLDGQAPRSVLPADAAPVTTTTGRVDGARAVSVSTSAADLLGDPRNAGADAMAAIDGNVFTAWQSRRGTGQGQWWQVEFDDPVELGGTSVQMMQNPFTGHAVTTVRVTTDDGSSDHDVPTDGPLVLDQLGQSRTLRITVTGTDGTNGPNDSVGIVDVTIPDVTVREELVVAGGATRSWLLAARTDSRTHCVPAVPSAQQPDGGVAPTVCNDGLLVAGPDTGTLARVLDVEKSTSVTGRAWVAAAATAESARLADRLAQPSVVATGSSVAARDLITRPQAAADADLTTAWRPAPEDPYPVLTLSWQSAADISGLRLLPPADDLGSVPTQVRVGAEVAGRRGTPARTVTTDADVAADGSITIPDVRTRRLTVTVLADSNVVSVDSFTGGLRPVPIAVAEVSLVGGPAVTYDGSGMRRLSCGSGPVVSVAGKEIQTELTLSADQVVDASVVRAPLCSGVTLRSGESEVTVAASFSWQPLGLLLAPAEGPLGQVGQPDLGALPDGPAPVSTSVLDRPDPQHPVSVELGGVTTDRTTTLAVPAGTGWEARSADGPLTPVTVDGWLQGWVVPSGVEAVELRYSPGGSLGAVVAGAAVGWLLVVLLAAAGARRVREP